MLPQALPWHIQYREGNLTIVVIIDDHPGVGGGGWGGRGHAASLTHGPVIVL